MFNLQIILSLISSDETSGVLFLLALPLFWLEGHCVLLIISVTPCGHGLLACSHGLATYYNNRVYLYFNDYCHHLASVGILSPSLPSVNLVLQCPLPLSPSLQEEPPVNSWVVLVPLSSAPSSFPRRCPAECNYKCFFFFFSCIVHLSQGLYPVRRRNSAI